MLKSYLITGWRNLFKYKVFSFINVFGMAVAMSVCMLLILMVADQKSYDQFHRNKDRVYRIVTSAENNFQLRATIPFPVAAKLKSEFPIIEDAVYLRRGFGGDALFTDSINNNRKIFPIKGYFTTPSFFQVFSFDLEKGDTSTALRSPNTMVISHDIAEKLFGGEDPVGKTISFSDRGLNFWDDESKPGVEWGNFTITGVFAKQKLRSHIVLM
jgi:putative ABC transport system permease protein